MQTSNTILLTKSGDLLVYEGKRPKEDLPFVSVNYYQWLSTKKVVKMAEGEYERLIDYGFGQARWPGLSTYPIDVSDIVTEKDGLYYFSPPVDKEEEMLEDLIGWAEIKSIEEGLDGSVYQSHFEDGFISAVKYIFENYTLKRR